MWGCYPHFYHFAGKLQDKVNPASIYQSTNAQMTQKLHFQECVL